MNIYRCIIFCAKEEQRNLSKIHAVMKLTFILTYSIFILAMVKE